jgi:hypothetical protein
MGVSLRTLFFIPIVHTQTDMGQLSESVQRATIQKLGIKAWRHKMRAIDERWAEIERVVAAIPLHYEKVRLYQDGLPICGREEEIIRELAEKGSRNHRLLLDLMEKGATLMGTESPELLLIEYQLVKETVEAQGRARQKSKETAATDSDDTLLDRRNRFIAQRINSTLQRGETGILFLGMLHTLENLLDDDMQVIYPISQPVHLRGNSDG